MDAVFLWLVALLLGYALSVWMRTSDSVWWTTVLPLALAVLFLWLAGTADERWLFYLFFGLMGLGSAAPGRWGLAVFAGMLVVTGAGIASGFSVLHILMALLAVGLIQQRWKEVASPERRARTDT